MALKNIMEPDTARRQLVPWLERLIPDASEMAVTDVVTPKAAGMSAETLMFTADYVCNGSRQRDPMVARVIKPDPRGGLYMVYDLEKEATAMRAYRAHTDVPTPEVLAVEHDPGVLGGPFLAMRAVAGRVPPDDPPYTAEGWVLDLTPEQRALMHDNALRMLAKVHAASPHELGLERLVPPEGLADPLGWDIERWRRAYEWSRAGAPNPVLDAAWEWIDANRPASVGELAVSWGDARFGNMIFDDDLEVRAVLDWEQMTLGPRELDLSWWTLTSYRHHGAAQGLEIPAGFPSFDGVVERYTELTGYEPRDLHFYDVYSGIRLSILAVRAATLLIEAGVMPPDTRMAQNNPTTDILIDLLDLPKPEDPSEYYIGKR